MMLFILFCCVCFVLTLFCVVVLLCAAFCFLYNFRLSKIQKPSDFEKESLLNEILKMG